MLMKLHMIPTPTMKQKLINKSIEEYENDNIFSLKRFKHITLKELEILEEIKKDSNEQLEIILKGL